MRINLTKEDTLLLKGAAIMAIIFHNFYHKFEGGIVENEFTFHPNSYWEFWELFYIRDSISLIISFHFTVTMEYQYSFL